jgi:hypothetical protein
MDGIVSRAAQSRFCLHFETASINMLIFDRRQMLDQIESLPKRLRVVFAAACAQRQLPNYVRTSTVNPTGDSRSATRILRELWDDVTRNEFEVRRLRSDRAVCEALIPNYDQKYFEGIEYADDAIASLAYAIDTAISGSGRETLWAVERAYSALDHYIIQRFTVDVNVPRVQSLIDSFPMMQAELARQQADLAELRASAEDPDNQAVVIARIKHRAENDAASFFG